MTKEILFFEELSLNALPSLQTQYYDGWVLRYTSGYRYTNRANSVNLLYPSSLDLQTKINECEKRYLGLNMPPTFKITDGTDVEVDLLLERMGYETLYPTYMKTVEYKGVQRISKNCLLFNTINKEWQETFYSLSTYTDEKRMEVASSLFDNIKTDVICGKLIIDGAAVACGLCVIEHGYMGLYNIIVGGEYRGKGYGEELCESLIAATREFGVNKAYLQVMADNTAAINLYAKYGYNTIYSYWYRVKNVSTM